MSESGWQRQYRQDARLLGELGRVLALTELPRVEVRLPKALAELAVTAWEREDNDGPLDDETHEQRLERHRAGTLALIGLGITERGRWDGDDVIVELGTGLIALAIDASDDLPAA
jgi:hypothetical protein